MKERVTLRITLLDLKILTLLQKKFQLTVHKDAHYFCKENSSSRKSNVDQNQRTALRASQK